MMLKQNAYCIFLVFLTFFMSLSLTFIQPTSADQQKDQRRLAKNIQKLMKVLKKGDIDEQIVAMNKLATFGKNAEPAIPLIIPLMKQSHDVKKIGHKQYYKVIELKTAGANTLLAMQNSSPEVLDVLAEVITGPFSPNLKIQVEDGIFHIKYKTLLNQPTLKKVQKALANEKNEKLRLMIISKVAAQLGKDAEVFIPELNSMLEKGEESLKQDVLSCIADIGPAAKSAIPAIVKSVAYADEQTIIRGIEALEKINEPSSLVVTTLEFFMGTGDTMEIRKKAKDALYVLLIKSRVEEKASAKSLGSAWIVEGGMVVTSYHVIDGHDNIKIITSRNVSIPLQIVLSDKQNDLAILKPSNGMHQLPPAIPLSNNFLSPGEKVFTIGYPQTNIMGTEAKLSDGIVSSLSGIDNDPRFYQITTPVQAGNSGGPLINHRGEVVGVITAKLDALYVLEQTGDLPQNVNYAIKSSYLNILLSMAPQKGIKHRTIQVGNSSLSNLYSRIRPSIVQIVAE